MSLKLEKHLFVCTNERPASKASCGAQGAQKLRDELKSLCKKELSGVPHRINSSGCLGHCEKGIAAVLYPEGKWFFNLKAGDASKLVASLQGKEDLDEVMAQCAQEMIDELKNRGETRAPSEITVAVGMSGGVDSSVSALILKKAGFKVVGLFMKNWEEKFPVSTDAAGLKGCTAQEDFQDVARVCEMLEIPYYGLNFSQDYLDRVFKRFLKEYEAGHTPNPDILCNREIKFDVFLKESKTIGADYLATGHYARTVSVKADGAEPATVQLQKGADPTKDQSYFIYTLQQTQLAQLLFPIGNLPKSQVRKIAKAAGLIVHDKKDSTGICFIGERKFKDFLSQYIPAKPGNFCFLDGTVVGKHQGVAFYTLGQRRGLGLGGEGESWYVIKKDPQKNIVYVHRGEDCPELYSTELWASEISWVNGAPPSQEFQARAKIRYRQRDEECTVNVLPQGKLHVVFREKQRAVTPCQSIVLYAGEKVLGGAVIE